MIRRAVIPAACAALALVAGCQSMEPSQQRTARDTGIGAAAGAAIGAVAGGSDNRGRGAAIGAAVGALGGYAWNQRMENQRRLLEQSTQGTGVQVEKTADNRIRVVVPDAISFDTGRADIKPSFRPVLDNFAQTMAANPGATVQIVGHTDSTGSAATNDALSRERALATRDYLTTRGVAPTRISIDGRGSREPVADNSTDAGRARNRRVELFVQDTAA
jgi:outer membrane protein OmpA-like peptidoglycan-associated protein